MFKTVLKLAGAVAIAGGLSISSVGNAQESKAEFMSGLWAKPISNPVYTDLAVQKREINFIYIYNALPSHVDSLMGNIPLDGEFHAMAIQAEIPVMDNLSIVADKSGAVIFRPDDELDIFDSNEGLTNLAAGLKWSFFQNEKIAAALRGTVELPSGDTEVFQGNGTIQFCPSLLLTHLGPKYVLNGMVGAALPLDGSELSTMGFASLAGAYRVTDKLSGHLELNYFRVLEAGSGEESLNDLPPGTQNIFEFEGGDLINLGSSNSDEHPDFVSIAVGARYQITDRFNVGVAYELPLTPEDRGLMDHRVTVDLGVTF